MYQQFWNKYIPAIRILLKRTATGDQILDLNRFDFEHAGMTRKAGYKFDIELVNGRVSNHIGNIPLAADLAAILLEDPAVQTLLSEHDFVISLNTRYQLSIKRVQAKV